MKRRTLAKHTGWRTLGDDEPARHDRGDWWRVALMVAAVLCGSALALYALIEWASGT